MLHLIAGIIITAVFIYAATMFTWGMYLSVMNLMEQKDKLTLTTKIFAYPIAAIGVFADFFYNITVGTLMFLELPKEYLLTMRLDRHLTETGWRGKRARWACKNFLDPFARDGRHCVAKVAAAQATAGIPTPAAK